MKENRPVQVIDEIKDNTTYDVVAFKRGSLVNSRLDKGKGVKIKYLLMRGLEKPFDVSQISPSVDIDVVDFYDTEVTNLQFLTFNNVKKVFITSKMVELTDVRKLLNVERPPVTIYYGSVNDFIRKKPRFPFSPMESLESDHYTYLIQYNDYLSGEDVLTTGTRFGEYYAYKSKLREGVSSIASHLVKTLDYNGIPPKDVTVDFSKIICMYGLTYFPEVERVTIKNAQQLFNTHNLDNVEVTLEDILEPIVLENWCNVASLTLNRCVLAPFSIREVLKKRKFSEIVLNNVETHDSWMQFCFIVALYGLEGVDEYSSIMGVEGTTNNGMSYLLYSNVEVPIETLLSKSLEKRVLMLNNVTFRGSGNTHTLKVGGVVAINVKNVPTIVTVEKEDK